MKLNMSTKGTAFELEVEQILRLRGYTVVRNNLIGGTQIDLTATKSDPLENLCFIVECTDRHEPLGVDIVKQKTAILLALKSSNVLYRLMIVTRKGFTAEAKAFAASQPTLLLLTLNELENLLLDFSPYADWYTHNFSRSNGMFKEPALALNYVALSARGEKDGEVFLSLEKRVLEWLQEDKSNLLLLLGEYGSGKTSFSRHFTFELLNQKYKLALNQRITPLLINLKDVRSRFDIRQLIVETLSSQYGVSISSFAAFERACGTENILLVLDGFDEMCDRSDRDIIVDAFNQIYLFAALNSKILLTCRSNFFRSHSDVIEVLKEFSISIPLPSEGEALEIPFKHQATLLYVDKLSQSQILEFIKKRFGNRADEVFRTIKEVHDLSDLSTRPVLLDMIITTLPDLQKDSRRINSAALYEHYTAKWTNRDQWRASLSGSVKAAFCEAFAWSMHSASRVNISYADLEKLLTDTFSEFANDQMELSKFKNDIQTCSFLVRAGGSDVFQFAHKSFLEFFVARKLARQFLDGLSLVVKPVVPSLSSPSQSFSREDSHVVNSHYYPRDYPARHYSFALTSLRESMARMSVGTVGTGPFADALLYTMPFRGQIRARWSAVAEKGNLIPHLESSIKDSVKDIWAGPKIVGISEEIATFALEVLENSGTKLEELIGKLKDSDTRRIFADVLRLGKPKEWLLNEAEFFRNYVLKPESDQLVKVAVAVAFSRVPRHVTLDLILNSKKSLGEDGWSYLLFELAMAPSDFSKLFQVLFKSDDVRSLDQIICLYGLSKTISDDDSEKLVAEKAANWIASEEAEHFELVVNLCTSLPDGFRERVLLRVFDRVTDRRKRTMLVEALGVGNEDWKRFRALAASEKSPTIRDALSEIEQFIRDRKSRSENLRRNEVSGPRRLRETLWARMGK
jgi:Cdc6-like AAA superfamily ATPase